LSPSSSLLLLAKTITHPAARSLCDSWASCIIFLWFLYFFAASIRQTLRTLFCCFFCISFCDRILIFLFQYFLLCFIKSLGHTGSYDCRMARFVRKSSDARPVSYFRYDLPLRSHNMRPLCDWSSGRTTGLPDWWCDHKTYLRLCKIYRTISRCRSRLIVWLHAASRSRLCD